MTRLLFFGRLRDLAGYAERELALPDEIRTVEDLRAYLGGADPSLGEAISAPGVRVAVNRAFCVNNAASVRDAGEIAFMSPLSGG